MITECRSSGLTDYLWCKEHGFHPGTFCNWVSRLRKKACYDIPGPFSKDDDIIVKVTSTAICGSDLHLVHGLVKGMYDGYVLGHETMGIVEETEKGVKRLNKGDRVIIPFPAACGHCEFCSWGKYSQCDNSNDYAEAVGLLGYSKYHGNYAQGQAKYIRVKRLLMEEPTP